MPSEVEFDRAILRTEEHIRRLDDAVVDTIEADDGSRQIGFVAERNAYTYRVVGDPEADYFTVLFPFSIVAQLAGLISADDSRHILQEEVESGEDAAMDAGTTAGEDEWEDLPEEELFRRGATAALDRVGGQSQEEFVYHLVIVLSSGSASYSLRSTEAGMVSGFDVSTKLFPFEGEYPLSTFDRRVESVVTTGIGGMLFVNQAFDFQSMVDTAELSGMLPWYIH